MMQRLAGLLFATVIFACAGLAPATAAGRIETIAAVVNDDAVSASDVEARMKMVMISSGLPNSPEIREKVRPQIVNALIEERLMLQEAARLGITVTPEDIEDGLARIAEQNNLTKEQFKSALQRDNISPQTLADQVRSQIAWSRVIQAELRPQVDIPDSEIDAALERLQASQGKSQYLVSEIFLPVSAPAEEADVRHLANRLVQQMSEGGVPFQRVASQFSQAAGATRGGDLGWVQEGQLPEALDEILARMQEGELSTPVRTPSGFHILYLRKRSALSADSLPTRDQIYNKLGLEQLERLQRRYLLDLKTAAFIERRV